MFDLSLFSDNRTVVHCKTEAEAERLFEDMFAFCPEYMDGFHQDSARRTWDMWRDETCYWIVKEGDSGRCWMQYCSCNFFRNNEYKILPFEDVFLDVLDYGEFQTEGSDISSLF